MRFSFRCLVLIVILVTVCSEAHAQQSAGVDNPVVFIPGILGSNLSDDKGVVVWGDLSGSIRRFQDLALPVDPKQTRIAASGVLERLHILGPWSAGFYSTLLDDFDRLGFKQHKTLFVFDYDWRLSTLENAERLRAFVDRLRAQRAIGSSQKVNLVGHSMGGMIARIFILKFEGQRDVDRLITLATPHFGSLNAVQILLNGFGGLEDFVVGGRDTVRAVAWTFPGLLELLPTYENCCYVGRGPQDVARKTLDILDPGEWVRRGWVPAALLAEPGRQQALQKSFAAIKDVAALMRTPLPGGIPHHKVYGALVETRWKFFVDPTTGSQRWIHDSGDGTVPLVSALAGDGLYGSPLIAQHATIYRDRRTGPLLETSLRKIMVPFAAGAVKGEVDVPGLRIEARSIGVRLDRRYYETGTRGRLRIDLTDEEGRAIVGATVEVEVMSGVRIVSHGVLAFHTDASSGWYEGEFLVPSVEGAYQLRILVRGMTNPLEEAFLAVTKGGA